jgi:hypothetical protein
MCQDISTGSVSKLFDGVSEVTSGVTISSVGDSAGTLASTEHEARIITLINRNHFFMRISFEIKKTAI